MSEIRKDPLLSRWVVMAPERAERPHQTAAQARSGADPFAEGNEDLTTPEVHAIRAAGSVPNGPGWQVRVVPNMYPAVHTGEFAGSVDISASVLPGTGVHDVIIECPHNESNLSRLSHENVRDVLTVYRDRLRQLKQDPRLAHATIFKNQGAEAGASVHHSHSQLIATSLVPVSIQEELTAAKQYHDLHKTSYFERTIERELQEGSRIVLATDQFVVFNPFASRFTYETWIVPRWQSSQFESTPDRALDQMAFVLRTVLRKLEVALADPPWNYVLHTAPFAEPELPHFRWHIEIYPRLTRAAGFEWGAGCFLNEVLPEQAAARLRATNVD